MGNSESSSQIPAGTEGKSGIGRGNKSEEEKVETSSTSIRTAVKVGAAVAGTALMAWGAWNMATSSRSEHPEDDRRRNALGATQQKSYSHFGSPYDSVSDSGAGGNSRGGRGLITGEHYSYQPEKNDHAARTIKFMTYNVWKQEGEELLERIQAIGRLVEKHDPDVIFFQEVTPNIKRMFGTLGWWGNYNCSDSSENATEGDFCIVLSKLPIKAERCVSSTARKLPGCELDVGIGRSLYVASGHLKKANPPEMYCDKRTNQAKEAMKSLNCSPNAVFGGDMNWDDDRDGQFPLLERWVDAWTHLEPNKNGWTFDTKSNKSLKGRKLVQKRLDRFACKLRDFTLKDIKMIGNDAKPPSDHYGLLLTICYK